MERIKEEKNMAFQRLIEKSKNLVEIIKIYMKMIVVQFAPYQKISSNDINN